MEQGRFSLDQKTYRRAIYVQGEKASTQIFLDENEDWGM